MAKRLVDRYGRRVEEVLPYVTGDAAVREPIVRGEPELRGELAYQRDHEMAVHFEDSVLRRMRLGMYTKASRAP